MATLSRVIGALAAELERCVSEVLAQVLEQQRAEPPRGVLGDPMVDARYRGILRTDIQVAAATSGVQTAPAPPPVGSTHPGVVRF
jgi:hypothetical protein